MGRQRKVPSGTQSKGGTTPTNTTTTTDKGFGVQLKKNGIFFGRLITEKPDDITTVQEYLDRTRRSASPDQEAYDQYVEQIAYGGGNEASVQSNAWQFIAKHPTFSKTPGYAPNLNFQWTEVESALTFGLSDAKPDYSECFRRDQYPDEACDALGGALVPTPYDGAMPTFCAEWKGPDVLMPSAEKQCAYDGALMVDAAFEALKYMKKNEEGLYGKTQAITLAMNGEYAHFYTNHVVKKASGLQYHQYAIGKHTPTNSLKEYKETRKQLRNAQDWGRERAGRDQGRIARIHTFQGGRCRL